VVTSRNRLTSLVAADGAHPITLDLLTDHEAHELLTRRLGPDRIAAEPRAVEVRLPVPRRSWASGRPPTVASSSTWPEPAPYIKISMM
jgi:hypothetical protein